MIEIADLKSAVQTVLPQADHLFKEIGQRTKVGSGICRPPYGEGEQVAADVLAATARRMDLEVESDWAGNLYMTYPGTAANASRYVLGSHLDSVPQGGNFDGLAGIVAGLSTVAALQHAGLRLRHGVTVMGIRAEENAWFGAQHIGSRVALGIFEPELLDSARRIDTGRTLGEHIVEAGFDIRPIQKRTRYFGPGQIKAYIELHIEQGPLLESRAYPVGVVTGIRGNVRCAEGVCVGRYDHSGTVPRELRKDAVMAAAQLAIEMDALWQRWLEEGRDLVLTFGKFTTDPAAHSLTTIPGEVRFSFDARSHSTDVLAAVKAELLSHADEIGLRRGVEFKFGRFSQGEPAAMTDNLRRRLAEGATELEIPFVEMASGAGHDAADFALAGVSTAMIFVRNANGSHNPAEDMRIEDFGLGVELLLWLLTRSE
jgi:N-carbamoyl-L-amino-acid hydrolase